LKLASFIFDGTASWGVVQDGTAADLGHLFPDLRAALAAGAPGGLAAAAASAPRRALADIAWAPVVPNPGKILCAGINYAEHRRETGREAVDHPTIFTRFPSSQTGHLCAIPHPAQTAELDYEGELAVVIGTAGRHITARDALAHVAGYACYMDGSVRDWQRHTSQFTPGKNFPQTGPFGPWMVTPDEMGALGPQRLRTRVNGAVLQDATLDQMIFGVPALIAYCSAFTRLEPGDVIVTGTPGGVGSKRQPPVWLRPGDTVEVEIDGIGVLRNTVGPDV
jgi:2-keto-4-pentenoate hydratase/2-oxohepta-3-ene-1,7-dioic acid hydratase in catechol pathway